MGKRARNNDRLKKIGLVINPIAGMGGKVGLKGTDGVCILEKALALGAEPESPHRTAETLQHLKRSQVDFDLITYPGEMGEDVARNCGFDPKVIGDINPGHTRPSDTITACKELSQIPVDLLLFAGGDGTARDVYSTTDKNIVTLGIPTGVKMHSAVYASNPVSAADLTMMFLQNRVKRIKQAEVMDIDEDGLRQGIVSAKLYGYLNIPYARQHVRGLKAGTPPTEVHSQQAIAEDIFQVIEDDCFYIIGPGTTTQSIMGRLGVKGTLLGVDLIKGHRLIAADLNEEGLMTHIQNKTNVKIIVTPIGGQGYLFGRGNQPISPAIIQYVSKENVIIVATPDKIQALLGQPMIVDTSDQIVNRMLEGYMRVNTGYRKKAVYRIIS